MTKLSIVIINYNVKYFLEQTLLSVRNAIGELIRHYPSERAEVLVVDNNSVDGSQQMLRAKFPEVQLIANKTNVGFARANNQAIEQASGSYILLLNPDTVVEEDTLYKVVSFMDAHPEAGGLGVKMVDGKGEFLPESKRMFPSPEVAFYKAFGLSALFPSSRTFGKYHLGYLSKDETHPVDVLAGAFMLVRHQVIQEIGALDETFFMYGEDVDFSYRIKQAGYENYYYPHTRIIHYKGESTKKQSINYVFVFYQAMIIFAKKHFSRKKAAMFSLLLNTAIYFRAALAIGYRMLKQLALPALDYAFLLTGLYLIIWEFADGPIIDPPYYFHLPGAALIWVFAAYLTGNYQQPYTYWKILKGAFSGVLGVAAVYAFLPDALQVFRPLIVTGGVFFLGVLAVTRLLFHYASSGNLWLANDGKKRIVIIGQPEEAARVEQLLADSRVRFQRLGYVLPDDQAGQPQQNSVIGTMKQLGEICTIYPVDELIFCAKDVPSQSIISWMVAIQDQQIEFKIAPEESLFIIGSQSKDMPGDFYTIDITLGLAQSTGRLQKQVFDYLTALVLLLSLPVTWWFVKRKKGYVRNLWSVLTGRLSWVGYQCTAQPYQLPAIKQGIFKPGDELPENHLDQATVNRLDFLYARDYTPEKDLKILIRNFYRLGETNQEAAQADESSPPERF